jgi:hypothetical protein
MLSVTVRWVREHTRNGLVPCVRLGRCVRYQRAEILSYVNEQRCGGSNGPGRRPGAR